MELEYQLQMNIPEMSTSGHAYLEELEHKEKALPYSITNSDDERRAHWAEQKRIYGFDDSETWDLSSTFYAWLYEHLRMYVDIGGKIVNLDFHKFEFKGHTYTQLELINEILERIRFYFSDSYDDFDEEYTRYVYEVGEIWALILPAMWW